ncbi:RluA family pseudouridine synthase [uncultured Sphaerochaeta sp.]|uniref:RluA family pseudouridine synthase n=1 Tax=uncultured Sphaerochaeta sp. TaxID=886478 RepID=UPI002A0A2D04|nr:RluA family pseudouridine synthase [uncultured Sphaerochaeta sp.]
MNNPLPSQLAEKYCQALQESLDLQGCLDYESEGKISTSYLFGPARGQMFGVLVCLDPEGKEVILKAFSGQYDGKWNIEGWVPPVCDVARFNVVVARYDSAIHDLTDQINKATNKKTTLLRQRRKELSSACLAEIYALYAFRCLNGNYTTIADIFKNQLPPSGTGDCCAPKLLNYAFLHNLQIISMAEFYYGETNRSQSKLHKHFYGPCDDKCKPLLASMLGLDIIYCDETLLVVNKKAGMLSVPGKGEAMQDCVETRVKRLFPSCINQPAVHRLDMDTSGLLVLCCEARAHRNLSIQFMDGKVSKQYIALLEGVLTSDSGVVELPFRLDIENRPRQVFDEAQGKWGITKWEKLTVEYFKEDRLATRVLFTPQTGRTHQLRLHSAHEKGLQHPIIGDRLYGKQEEGQRMLLHASKITFFHPVTGEPLCFESKAEF